MADFTMYLRLPLGAPSDVEDMNPSGFRSEARTRVRLAQTIARGDSLDGDSVADLLADASELFEAAEQREAGKTVAVHFVTDSLTALHKASQALGSAVGSLEEVDAADREAISSFLIDLKEGLSALAEGANHGAKANRAKIEKMAAA